MTNEELRRALGLLAAQHAKLLSKPKRDFWDKIAVFVPLATGIVVTVTSVILTYRIQSIQTQAAENRKVVEQQAAEKKIEGERLAAEQRAAVEREAAERQRQFQQGLARTELLGKMIPFLIAKDGSADMALVAVTLTKDGEMMEAITRMMPRNAATAMLAKVSEASGTTAELRDRASAVLGDIAEQSAEGESTWGSRALIVALRELKQKVREEPSGSNRGARIDEYHRATGFEPGHSWSGIFVKYCFQQAVPEGTTAPATLQPPFGSIRAELTVKRFWRAANSKYIPKPGDLVIYGRGTTPSPSHGGIVVSTDGRSITAIEGNTRDSTGARGVVAARTRPLADVLGFGDMQIPLGEQRPGRTSTDP
jgi:hypothetical protein